MFSKLTSTSGIQTSLMVEEEDEGLDHVARMAYTVKFVVLLLSSSSLSSLPWAIVVHMRYIHSTESCLVPVVLPGFEFPSNDFYVSECRELAEKINSGAAAVL